MLLGTGTEGPEELSPATPSERSPRAGRPRARASTAAIALTLGPAALIVFMGFDAGGYFPATQAIAAVALTQVLLVRLVQAERPLAGFGVGTLAAVAALAGYAALTLASALWSHSTGRALIEVERVWLYVLVLTLFGAVPASGENARRLVRGIVLGIAVVCAAGLVSRVAPDLLHTAPGVANERLSYPVTYWNALGLLAALGVVLAVHLTCSLGERRVTRALAAGAVPLLAATLFFTFSRGAIAASAIGLVAYALVGRPKALLGGALATLAPTGVLMAVAYKAKLLDTVDPTTPAAVAQGHRVALVALACSLAAAALRLVCAQRMDGRVHARLRARADETGAEAAESETSRSWIARRGVRLTAIAGALAAIVLAVPALGIPSALAHDWTRFAGGATPTGERGDLRARLTDPSNDNRTALWSAALKAFAESPTHGHGAGTFQTSWERQRPRYMYVVDAHSLYLQALAELGIPGLTLLAILVGVALWGLARRARGPRRSVYGAMFAVALMWALHAGVDWDWEMPVVTIPFLAVVGLGLGPRGDEEEHAGRYEDERSDEQAGGRGEWVPRHEARLLLGLACLATLALPALAIGSQRRLGEAEHALYASDCGAAIADASASLGWLDVRAQPYEVLGFCDLRRGLPQLGVEAMQQAVAMDPVSWEPLYGLALARASAGLDPRPQLRQAQRLDPLEPLLVRAMRLLDRPGAGAWVTGAARARNEALASNRLSIRPA